MGLNYKKFDRKLISYLKKCNQKHGDISHIVNEFVNDDINIRNEINRQLHYLRDRDIVMIRDLPKDDKEVLQDDWWGNFLVYNPTAGYKVEGLLASLGNKYLDLSWQDRNPICAKLFDYFIGGIIGALIVLAVEQSLNYLQQQQSQAKPSQSKNDYNTSGDSLHHNKDTVSLTKKK
jgi:hypothetical protein